jgi:hypothetical protein
VEFKPAECFTFHQTVKALTYERDSSIETSDKQKRTRDFQARRLLKQTFGNKKVKKKLLSMEHNQVKMENLQSLSDDVGKVIDRKAKYMPMVQRVQQLVNEDRPIPPFNPETTNVSEIYKLEDSKSRSCEI